MKAFEVPADGPEGPLIRIARRLKLPYSDTFIATAVARHPKPTTLLALVEVGAKLGLKITPGEADASMLSELELPAVVHFKAGDGEGGFAVLEGFSDAHFEVWDTVNGRRTLETDEFVAGWSGIVALVERNGNAAVSEKGRLKRRLQERFVTRPEAPSVVGGPGARPLRAAFTVALLVLLLAALMTLPAEQRLAAALFVTLTAVGLVAATIAAISVGGQSTFASGICRRGKLVDCKSVLTSRYSRFLGFSMSDIGVAFFGSILLLVAGSALGDAGTALFAAGLAYLLSVPLSLTLIGAQISMKQLCTLCLAVHVVNPSCAALAWWLVDFREVTLQDGVTSVVLLGFYFGLLLFFVIPYFHRSQAVAYLAGMQRRMSASPFASLAQVATEPITQVRGRDCGVAINDSESRHELVAFVNPGCNKCGPLLREVYALAGSRLVNAFVSVLPKDTGEPEIRACSVLTAVGLTRGGATMFEAYLAAKAGLPRFLGDDPISVMTESLGIPRSEIEGALEPAGRLVRHADQLAADQIEGTPAVFFDGRYYKGPLSHLHVLLDKHPELLS